MNISRRQFILGGGIAAAGVAIAGSTLISHENTEEIEFAEIPITISSLPKEFDHYRIGFLSDIHLGRCMSEDFVESCFRTIATAQIDIMILGGDYVWIPESPVALAVARNRSSLLKNLSPADLNHRAFSWLTSLCDSLKIPDGVIAVLGNHDRWTHPTAAVEAFHNSKINLLRNSDAVVTRGNSILRVVGVEDYLTGFPMVPTLPDRREKEARVLISHNPDYVSDNGATGFELVLCGHTHGGQIRIPWLGKYGALVVNAADKRFLAGAVQLGDSTVYTSRGVGVVEIPYRINCRPEINVFMLKSA